jgi:FMN-dependent oxidoreductase (nitrilotriacetate monooxygenase family)
MTRQIKLGAFLPGGGQHVAAWRHPDAPLDGALNLEFYKQLARTAERGLFDAYFLADNLAVNFGAKEGGGAAAATFEPVTLFAALSTVTTHLGFIATASTTYEEPYNLARKFASLDHISAGRAGWNVVTSTGDLTAQNYGRAVQLNHSERYERAEEFVDVVRGLWDSWEDDAFIRDKHSGEFYDQTKVHALNYKGKHLAVRGPLNISRSVQGYPVIVQAGQSKPGIELAARTAEVIFTARQNLADAQQFYREVKAKLAKYGRSADQLKIMPGVAPFVGRSQAEAEDKYHALNELIKPEIGLALLNGLTGGNLDLNQYDLDGPLPELPKTQGMLSRQQLIQEIAADHDFTIRQLYQWVATARGHWTLVGTPEHIADQLQLWFENEAADGFNVLPPVLPTSLNDFVDLVIPELQKRGLFRTRYEGCTLRENLGLAKPVNNFSLPSAYIHTA